MKIKLIKMTGLLLALCATGAYATALAQIPQTGQTASYGPNDDGALGKGTVGTNTSGRFVAGSGAEAECITDQQTGLMWVKDLNTVNSGNTASSWGDAISIATGTSWCGHTDWRLPNRNELRSLVNYGQANISVWLNAQGFSNVQASYYWSSTTYAGYTNGAWYVSMNNGNVGSFNKASSFYVWPVRGGQ